MAGSDSRRSFADPRSLSLDAMSGFQSTEPLEGLLPSIAGLGRTSWRRARHRVLNVQRFIAIALGRSC